MSWHQYLVYFGMILISCKLSQLMLPAAILFVFGHSILRFFSTMQHLDAVLSSSLLQCFLDQYLSRLSLLLIILGDKSINYPGSFFMLVFELSVG